MSLPLREPFFLRGRKSVLQRAVIMSLVLGGMAAFASWIVAGTAVAVLGPSDSSLAISVVWGLAAAIFIHAPIQFWNGTSWRLRTIVAIPINAAALYLCVFTTSYESLRQLGRTFNVNFAIAVLLLINGAQLVRPLRLHIIAYVGSVLGGIVVAAIALAINDPTQIQIPLPGVPDIVELALTLAAVYGSLFGALAIPWGLPFWWPPQEDSPAGPTP